MSTISISPRLSGHETFVFRYAWLPKVVTALNENPTLFGDEDKAMVSLGVGKNMVRSAKFWSEAAQIIEDSPNGGHRCTEFGNSLLGHEGYDPYLENSETLWLLHWKISTHLQRPLFHWQQMMNFWHRPEFTESEALTFLERALPKDRNQISRRTISDGLKVFIASYVPSRGKKGEIAEDNLDSPLVELGLVRVSGERTDSNHQRETIYSFNVDPKPTIGPELFAYCIWEFWKQNGKFVEDKSLSARAITSEVGSPGQIFKLPESSVVRLLDELSDATQGALVFEESQTLQQVWKKKDLSEDSMLYNIYYNHP